MVVHQLQKNRFFFAQFFGHMVFSHTSSIWTYKLCKYWLYFDFFSLFIPLLMALNFQRFFSLKKMCLRKEINIKVKKKRHIFSLLLPHTVCLRKSMELIHLHLCSICLILIPFEYKTITGNRVATSYLKFFCCFCCGHTHTLEWIEHQISMMSCIDKNLIVFGRVFGVHSREVEKCVLKRAWPSTFPTYKKNLVWILLCQLVYTVSHC